MFEDKKSEAIKASLDDWDKNKVGKAISEFPERKGKFTTSSDLEVRRLYTPLDLEDMDYEEDLGFPEIGRAHV